MKALAIKTKLVFQGKMRSFLKILAFFYQATEIRKNITPMIMLKVDRKQTKILRWFLECNFLVITNRKCRLPLISQVVTVIFYKRLLV